MGFEKLGRVNFTSESKAVDFIKFLEQGKMMTTQCIGCGRINFPPKMDCDKCGASGSKWIELNEVGELLAFSTIFYGPKGFENDVPYTIAVVTFPKGVQVFGTISKGMPVDHIKIGMKLKVVAIKLPLGKVSYEFTRP